MRVCFVAGATCSLVPNSNSKSMSIIVYSDRGMHNKITRPVSSIPQGMRGWANYPDFFFGPWLPDSMVAKRSMSRMKRVTFKKGVGWVFDIEERIRESRDMPLRVGMVYAERDSHSSTPAPVREGQKGWLLTKEGKRVAVVCDMSWA